MSLCHPQGRGAARGLVTLTQCAPHGIPPPPGLSAIVPLVRALSQHAQSRIVPGSWPAPRPGSPAAGDLGGPLLGLDLPAPAAAPVPQQALPSGQGRLHNHWPTLRLSLGPEPSRIRPSGGAPRVPRGQPARAQSALDRPGQAHCPRGPALSTVLSTGQLRKGDTLTLLHKHVSKGSHWRRAREAGQDASPLSLGAPPRPASRELSGSQHTGLWRGPGAGEPRWGQLLLSVGSAQKETHICVPQEEKAPTRSSFWKYTDTPVWPRTVLRGQPGPRPERAYGERRTGGRGLAAAPTPGQATPAPAFPPGGLCWLSWLERQRRRVTNDRSSEAT